MNIAELYKLYRQTTGICTDSRKVFAGCMYISLKGETFDGNKFALEALKKGASYSITDDTRFPVTNGLMQVENGLKALQDLSSYHRHQFDIPVIGVTGSNGKTTTKELIQSVLSQKFNVLATVGNFNNHIGVPLTLFGLDKAHEIAIIEMGASSQGEIKELSDIADPNYGLITNIGKAHLETMGGLEGVLKTKTELFDHIRINSGKLLVHSSDKALVSNTTNDECFHYGALSSDDVQGGIIRDGNLVSVQWKRKDSVTALEDSPIVKTNLTGAYNLPNIMAAVATGIVFGLNDDEIAKGISSYQPSNNRSEVKKKGSNTFILDAYNANPSSMEVAINNLMGTDGDYHSVILGEMLEVGSTSTDEHKAICQRLQILNIKTVCLVGSEFTQFKNEFQFNFFENVDELVTWLNHHHLSNETVLIKGSRGNKLEKATAFLLA
ncbi:MAG: UDP-N-acetylmuramoyl-tripeptide--D-alanyl-D-alanine ligase [Bacteroidia bacterium]|jgi:UDP-N-acetylmuramoyl-tripeptide--D-alanyl-D-alanine ligase